MNSNFLEKRAGPESLEQRLREIDRQLARLCAHIESEQGTNERWAGDVRQMLRRYDAAQQTVQVEVHGIDRRLATLEGREGRVQGGLLVGVVAMATGLVSLLLQLFKAQS